MMPGPLGFDSALPSRKMTPRSYSRRTLMQLNRYRTKMMTMIGVGVITQPPHRQKRVAAAILSQLNQGKEELPRYCWRLADRYHREHQAVDIVDAHLLSNTHYLSWS